MTDDELLIIEGGLGILAERTDDDVSLRILHREASLLVPEVRRLWAEVEAKDDLLTRFAEDNEAYQLGVKEGTRRAAAFLRDRARVLTFRGLLRQAAALAEAMDALQGEEPAPEPWEPLGRLRERVRELEDALRPFRMDADGAFTVSAVALQRVAEVLGE